MTAASSISRCTADAFGEIHFVICDRLTPSTRAASTRLAKVIGPIFNGTQRF